MTVRHRRAFGGAALLAIVPVVLWLLWPQDLGVLNRMVLPALVTLVLASLLLAAAAVPDPKIPTAAAVFMTVLVFSTAGVIATVLSRESSLTVGWSDQLLSLVVDGSRAVLVAIAALAAGIAIGRGTWPEYLAWSTGVLATVVIAGGLISAVSGRFADAPAAVPEPRLGIAIDDAVVLDALPEAESVVSVIVVVPRYDKDRNEIGNDAYQFVGWITRVPSSVTTPGQAVVEFTRGEEDGKVKDVLLRLTAANRTVYVAPN